MRGKVGSVMKALFFNFQYFRGRFTGLLAAMAMAGVTSTAHALTAVDSAAGTATPPAGTSKGVVLSPGALDVLRMVQAKVSPQVITAYVKSSVTSFNLSANDIIVLRHLGVTDEVLAAMLERSGELRAQPAPAGPAYATAPAAAQPAAVPPDATAWAPPPDYSYAVGTTPSDYGYGDSYNGYYPYPYYSYYPSFVYYPFCGAWGCSYGYCGYHGCSHAYPGYCCYSHHYYGPGYPGFHTSQASSSHLYSGPTFTGPRNLYSGPTFTGPNNLIRNAPMNHFAGHTMATGGLAMRSAAMTRSAGAVRGVGASGGGHR